MAKKVRMREVPKEKTFEWYFETEARNPRLPDDINIGDILASGCACDCELIKEVYAEKLASYLLVEKEMMEYAAFSEPEMQPFATQMSKQAIEPRKKELRIPLEFKNLCKAKCPSLTEAVIWERAKELMVDSLIRQELVTTLVQHKLTDEELRVEFPLIKARILERVKDYEFPEEANILKDGKREKNNE